MKTLILKNGADVEERSLQLTQGKNPTPRYLTPYLLYEINMAYNGNNNFGVRYSEVPYHEQSDNRLPPPGTYPKSRISFQDGSGFDTHMLTLLDPSSKEMAYLMRLAREKRRANPNIPAYGVVSRAAFPPAGVEASLKHISDGPRGGIWVLAKGKEEVIVCLVDELEEFRIKRARQDKSKARDRGGWEVIGQGAGDWKGSVFLMHPCGDGGPDILEDEAKPPVRKGSMGGKVGARPAAGGDRDNWFGKVRKNFDL